MAPVRHAMAVMVACVLLGSCGGSPGSSPALPDASASISGALCGNGQCQPGLGEGTVTCPADCRACWGTVTASPGCCMDQGCFEKYGTVCLDDGCCDSMTEDMGCEDCSRTNLMDGCTGPIDVVTNGSRVYAKNNRMVAYGYMLDEKPVEIIDPKGFVLLPLEKEIPIFDDKKHTVTVTSFQGFDMDRWGTDAETAADKVAIANIGVVITTLVDLVGILPVDFPGTSVGFCMNVKDLKTVGGILYSGASGDGFGVLTDLISFVAENADNLGICLWEASIDEAKKDALIAGLKGVGKVVGEATEIYNLYVALGKVGPTLLDLWQAAGESETSYCASLLAVDAGACPADANAPPPPVLPPLPPGNCDVQSDHFCLTCRNVSSLCSADWKTNTYGKLLVKLEGIYAAHTDLFNNSSFTITLESKELGSACSGFDLAASGYAGGDGHLVISVDDDAAADALLAEAIQFTICHELAHRTEITGYNGGIGGFDGTDEQFKDWFAYAVCGYRGTAIRAYDALTDKSSLCGIDPRLDTTMDGMDCQANCGACYLYADGVRRGALSAFWKALLPDLDAYDALAARCEGGDCDSFAEAATLAGHTYEDFLSSWKTSALGCKSCTDVCTVGEQKCTAGKRFACVASPEGCGIWDAGTTCPSGSCADATHCAGCTPHHHNACYDHDVYSYDSCNVIEGKVTECGASDWIGATSCGAGNDVYQSYVTRDCLNAACTTSTASKLKQDCNDAGCVSGACCGSHVTYRCASDDVYWFSSCNVQQDKKQECGSSTPVGSNYCYDNDVYKDYDVGTCSTDRCTTTRQRQKQSECGTGGCVGGQCCTSHASKLCVSGDVYWRDSCGRTEGIAVDCDATQTCPVDACVCAASTPWTSNALTATVVTGGVSLSWSPAPSSWIHHYRVARAAGATTPPPGLAISPDLMTTSYVDRSGVSGQRYTYLVYGYDACGVNRNVSQLTTQVFP